MRTIFFAIIISIFLLLAVVPFQNASSQTGNESTNEEIRWLRSDLRTADVVAYVDVKQIKYAGSIGDADCENNKGKGYCSYLLVSEIKELFKGDIKTKAFEFYIGPDASYPKKNLLGEKIVFLIWGDDEKNGKRLYTIENSNRSVDALETMRKIVNPRSPIDEADESEPYSLASIKKEFEEADAVVYADVLSFKADAEDSGIEPFVLKAKIKEVFKGKLKVGQEFEYTDDLLYRPLRDMDLGEQILYLERKEENRKVVYDRIKYTIGDIEHDILEKLRKIAGEKSRGK